MNKLKMAMLSTFLLSALASAEQNPFDKGRVVPEAPAATLQQGEAPKPAAAPRKNVFCGVKQDLDRARICVDGQWLSLGQVESKTKRRVGSVGDLSVTLSPGGVYFIGDELGSRRSAAIKTINKEKRND